MERQQDTIIVSKNRKRALWSLVIIAFMLPVSGWLLLTGFQPGKPFVAWALVALGAAGLLAFGSGAVAVVRTMRSPWHLALDPSSLVFSTPSYDLVVGWERILGIAVNEVNRRPGCVLVFDDPAAVSQETQFRDLTPKPGAVADVATMYERMEENFQNRGYHFGIPGRILELGPDELADLLTRARTGALWRKREDE